MTISRHRLDKIRRIKDEDIDYSDIPELNDDWFEKATLVMPAKTPVPIEVDKDVVEWYQSNDKNYQHKINAILRAYMNKHKAHA